MRKRKFSHTRHITVEEADKLIAAYPDIKLVMKILNSYNIPPYVDYKELLNVGYIALERAKKSVKPDFAKAQRANYLSMSIAREITRTIKYAGMPVSGLKNHMAWGLEMPISVNRLSTVDGSDLDVVTYSDEYNEDRIDADRVLSKINKYIKYRYADEADKYWDICTTQEPLGEVGKKYGYSEYQMWMKRTTLRRQLRKVLAI